MQPMMIRSGSLLKLVYGRCTVMSLWACSTATTCGPSARPQAKDGNDGVLRRYEELREVMLSDNCQSNELPLLMSLICV